MTRRSLRYIHCAAVHQLKNECVKHSNVHPLDHLLNVDAIPRFMLGYARITLHNDGCCFEFDPDGGWAFVTPCTLASALGPEANDPQRVVTDLSRIIDLVAWRPEQPGEHALYTGLADWLGAIPMQWRHPRHPGDDYPVRIWRSPLRWYGAGMTGLVPLTRDPLSLYRLLIEIPHVIAEDAAHAQWLRGALRPPSVNLRTTVSVA